MGLWIWLWPWLLPFGASLALHIGAAVVIGTYFIGAYVLRDTRREPPVPIAVDFYAPSQRATPAAPSATPAATRAASAPQASAAPAPDAEFADRLDGRLDQALARSLDRRLNDRLGDRIGGGAPSLSGDVVTSAAQPPSVAFVGLQAPAASVVYVVDASGSLVGTFPTVLAELERSLAKLDPVQRFSVVFFQRNAALALPANGSLRAATPAAVRDAIAWARGSIRPSGRSNPAAALEQALALHPDLIFLLSTDITGSGDFEISRSDLLDRLDRLNAADDRGVRPTRIQCVQFLDADPLDTLRAIAEQHGGATGFRFLSREDLGLAPRR